MNYEDFVEMLTYGEEFEIVHDSIIYYVSQRRDLGELYFTIDEENYQTFYSVDDLLASPLFDGQKIEEVWDELDIY